MAIFGKTDKKTQQPSGTTTIAVGTSIIGEIKVNGKLHIDGNFEGKIEVDDSLSIGKSGNVKGEIFASKVTVAGKFEGSLNSDLLEILSEGKVIGKIITKDLIIEQKGVFIGESLKKDESLPVTIEQNKHKKLESKEVKMQNS